MCCAICRQAVPLTLAILNVSNPSLNAVDTLSRLSHDTDIQVAQNAVLALGERPLALLTNPVSCIAKNAFIDAANHLLVKS